MFCLRNTNWLKHAEEQRKFKQVVLNLLSNAVKFTPSSGQVRVVVRVAPLFAASHAGSKPASKFEKSALAGANNKAEFHKGVGCGRGP